MGKETVHNLRPEQLMDLLSIGLEADLSESGDLISDEQIREYFTDLVGRKIPADSSIVDSILIFLRENKRYGSSVSSRSLSEVLLDSKTELDLYTTIKDYSKRIYQTAVSKGENCIAGALYYVAIAAALVYHDTKISVHSWQTLESAFEDLSSKNWMIPKFTQLLKTAKQRCETKITDS